MKLKIEIEINEKELKKERNYNKEEVEEYMVQTLFEICEDWVMRGQEPDLEWSN